MRGVLQDGEHERLHRREIQGPSGAIRRILRREDVGRVSGIGRPPVALVDRSSSNVFASRRHPYPVTQALCRRRYLNGDGPRHDW